LNSKTFHVDLSIHSKRNCRGYFERSPLELERAIQERKKKKSSPFLNCGSLGKTFVGSPEFLSSGLEISTEFLNFRQRVAQSTLGSPNAKVTFGEFPMWQWGRELRNVMN
jgi:hypothetical protein